jgi:uncharacterized protein
MATQRQSGGLGQSGGVESIARSAKNAAGKGLPPVHLWNPPDCGDIDLRIAADGSWHYQKTPISRPALVRLFASILRRDGERYYLVTPVEKCSITVDDVPFLAVEMRIEQEATGRRLHFRTNVDDWVACGPGRALRFEPQADASSVKPYIHIRRGLWARLTRPLFYDLVELGEEREVDGKPMYGVASGGEFYAMVPSATLRDISG